MEQNHDFEADYFGLAAAWDEELYGKLKLERRIAWIIAGVSMAVAAMAVLAVMRLSPLKTVEPYVIMVDKTTGHSQAVRKLVFDENNPLTGRESVVLGEINEYVVARHTFDPADLNKRYMAIQLSTDAREFGQYASEVEREVNSLNAGTRRIVRVKSIVPNLATKSATVRFSTETSNFNQVDTDHWVATLTYDFLILPIELQNRYLNPLGFIIQTYRVDRENVN